ncbi:MAG: hypothetical protein HYV16_07370 [Gammaproteobacteria bacterium]|nr:hypothetical protein [Gammaproteobacteria bacterium]
MNWKILNAMALGLMWMGGYVGSPRALREHMAALSADAEPACCACTGDAQGTACRAEPGRQRLGQMFDA